MLNSLRRFIHTVPRRRLLMTVGLLLSICAPAGWWLISLNLDDGHYVFAVYFYMLIATAITFAAFGYIAGHFHESWFQLLEKDNLTCVLNQPAFYRRFDALYQIGLRYRDHVAVIMMDIDAFKQVNDRHNHLVGTDILKQIAEILHECMRETDVVARFGGDEFVIGIPRLVDTDHAKLIAERIRQAIEAKDFHSRGYKIKITMSLGVVVTLCHPDLKVDAIVQLADQMLYKAKHAGRNRVESQTLSDHPAIIAAMVPRSRAH